MSELTKVCPVLRPAYGIPFMAPVQTQSGLSVVGRNGAQPEMALQIQQYWANNHELREGWDRLDFFCIFCAASATKEVWQEVQCSTSTSTSQPQG